MGFRIASVERGGLGDELGLRRGDELIMINGEKLIDLIDYQQLMSCEELVLTVRDSSGELTEIECDKELDEQLGVEFEDDLLGPVRLCANKCKFCFVDQLPRGMRDTLYVRDDDWRMSLYDGQLRDADQCLRPRAGAHNPPSRQPAVHIGARQRRRRARIAHGPAARGPAYGAVEQTARGRHQLSWPGSAVPGAERRRGARAHRAGHGGAVSVLHDACAGAGGD